MGLRVRARLDDDLPALAEILVRVHAQDGYPVEGVADPVAWLTPERQIAAWTADLDGEPIGQAALTTADPLDDAARIWHEVTGGDVSALAIPVRLFIDPARRKHGAASHLLHAIQVHAAEHRLDLAFDVMLKDSDAIRLYEARGCVRIGTLTHHHSDGATEPAAVYTMSATDR